MRTLSRLFVAACQVLLFLLGVLLTLSLFFVVIGVPLMALAGFAVHQSVKVIREPSATAQVTVARLFDVEIVVGLAGATALAVAKGPTPQTLGVGAFVALAMIARLMVAGTTMRHWRRLAPPSAPSR